MKLNKWKEGKIYFTISGSNIKPTSYELDFNMAQNLINSSNDYKINLSKHLR